MAREIQTKIDKVGRDADLELAATFFLMYLFYIHIHWYYIPEELHIGRTKLTKQKQKRLFQQSLLVFHPSIYFIN